jgi:hypothetical protein
MICTEERVAAAFDTHTRTASSFDDDDTNERFGVMK